MNLTDDVLDHAYSIYDEWGPKRRIDRRKRIKDAFKEISSDELDLLLHHMEEVTHTVWEIARKGGDSKLGNPKVVELLKEKHPFLTSEGLTQAVFLVNYYAWHEGFDK